MITGKQVKVGIIIRFQGELWRVMSAQIIAPGNWRAFTQAKLRNVIKGTQTEYRFRSDESVERVTLDTRDVEYLYNDGDSYHFMDSQSYEQFHLTSEYLGDATKFLVPNMKLRVEYYEEAPIGVDLPQTVKLKVLETEPYVKTATATNQFKAAKVETGATIQVPGFITEGETIEIDTSSGEYMGRAK